VDPEHHAYRRRAHLAEIVALLGLPPPELLARSHLAGKFFSDAGMASPIARFSTASGLGDLADTVALPGTFAAGIDLPASTSLEARETHLAGDEKRRFLDFMRKMLQWAPERRRTAGELFQDAWLQDQT
jgi:serine/threonine-protein kinase SRPK3